VKIDKLNRDYRRF